MEDLEHGEVIKETLRGLATRAAGRAECDCPARRKLDRLNRRLRAFAAIESSAQS
jgi:hypothetical protein